MRIYKQVLAMLLCVVIAVTGCSASWVTTIDDILQVAAPALLNILNIIAIFEHKPLDAALAAKINADAASIKSIANDFANASAAAAPSVCSQLQAAITTYSQDENQVMVLANVVSGPTLEEINALSALVSGTVVGILAVLPNCHTATTTRLMLTLNNRAVPLPLKSFVNSYNSVLKNSNTGNMEVDAYAKSHLVHVHSKVLRILSLGHSY